MVRDWKTSIGGAVVLLATLARLAHWIDAETWRDVAGFAAAWIGLTAKDGTK